MLRSMKCDYVLISSFVSLVGTSDLFVSGFDSWCPGQSLPSMSTLIPMLGLLSPAHAGSRPQSCLT